MENKVPDDGSEDFVMILKILIKPLPEPWNNLYVFSSRIDSFSWRRIYLVEMGDIPCILKKQIRQNWGKEQKFMGQNCQSQSELSNCL